MDEMAFEKVDPATEAEQIENLERWRKDRDDAAARAALDRLREAASRDENLFPASIEAAASGVTTGEWADALRDVFGEYRAPTGIGARVGGARPSGIEEARTKVDAARARLGVEKLRMLVAKPGLDGHSNAAEQVALRARDVGFEVVYQGIRLTPEQVARAAVDEDVHVIGLSILSGAHNLLVPDVMDHLRAEGVDPSSVPVVVGGVIPEEDAAKLTELGVAAVYTPKDFDLTRMMGEIADLLGG
jgi:(2R)-ethylmalonyl-CoA mutase